MEWDAYADADNDIDAQHDSDALSERVAESVSLAVPDA